MTLTIALSKGRLLKGAEGLFGRAGLPFPPTDTRRLIVDTEGLRFVLVKDMDVPVYVEHGVADAGICGGDVLVESGSDVLVPLDLRYGRCRMVVAAPPAFAASAWPSYVRVATKYPNMARHFFEARGLTVEVVRLHGSVEIAPGLGLVDCIVDLVETGRTLHENGLVEMEQIAPSSARLIANRASDHTKRAEVASLLASLKQAIEYSQR